MNAVSVHRWLLITALLLSGGCRTLPIEPRMPLRLLSSEPLQLTPDCSASQSVVIDFVIEASGKTSNVAVPAVPECLRQALSAWVASFNYAPLPAATPSSVEWLLVTAPKL